MLSRTAESLYWMSRYIERAECTARLLEMGRRVAMLPGTSHRQEWRSVLQVSGARDMIDRSQSVEAEDVINLLMLDNDNPSSIRSCLARARANGRAVRTALTQEMWEALNDGWRRLDTVDTRTAVDDLPVLLEWVKQRAAIFRGASETSLLRNDGYDFMRLGGHIERVDMTLRLLDVKYYVLLPETEVVGGGRDHHQWTSVLHATSAMRAYHHVYRGDYSPAKIADFLLLYRAFPRSLFHCYDQIGHFLGRLDTRYNEAHACHATAQDMIQRLGNVRLGELFQSGLHQFVTGAIGTTQRLSEEVSTAYHFG